MYCSICLASPLYPYHTGSVDEIICLNLSKKRSQIYGDDAINSGLTWIQAAELNLLGRLYKHYDEAGMISFVPDPSFSNSKPYDFKGNILERVRQVISDDNIKSVFDSHTIDWKIRPFCTDWQPTDSTRFEEYAAVLLDVTQFRTSLRYDAINRVKAISYPQDVEGNAECFI